MKLPVDLLKYARFYCQAIEETLDTSVPQDIKNNINNIVRDIFKSYEKGNIQDVFFNLLELRNTIFPDDKDPSIPPEALSNRFVWDFLDDGYMWAYLLHFKKDPSVGPEEIQAAQFIVEDLKDLINTDGLFAKQESEIN